MILVNAHEDSVAYVTFIFFSLIKYVLYPTLPTMLGYTISKMPYFMEDSRSKSSGFSWIPSFLFIMFFTVSSVFQVFDGHFKNASTLMVTLIFLSYLFPNMFLCLAAFIIISWIAKLNNQFLKDWMTRMLRRISKPQFKKSSKLDHTMEKSLFKAMLMQ